MTAFGRRRLRNTVLVLVLSTALVAGLHLAGLELRDPRFISGWLLLAVMAGLMLFNLRRRIPVVPLGGASAWLQVHVYAGWFAVVAFLLHTGGGLPDGPFEAALWSLFVTVAVSGAIGLWLDRILPHRMTAQGGERVLYDHIPIIRANLAREAQALALASAQDTLSSTIADYYDKELRAFFRRPRHMLGHLSGYRGHLRRRLQQIESMNRYLDDRGRETMARIADLAAAKDDLDYQFAAQTALKLWLFVHVPASYALLAAAAVHGTIAYAFSVGAP